MSCEAEACPGLVDEAGVLGHAVEDAVLALQQLLGRREVHELALVQYHDASGVHYGVEPVSDRQHRARCELRSDGFLSTINIHVQVYHVSRIGKVQLGRSKL